MQGAYGGLVVVMFYGGGGAFPEEFFLITHTNLDILTQSSLRILIHQ
jgi:hypothetical protein